MSNQHLHSAGGMTWLESAGCVEGRHQGCLGEIQGQPGDCVECKPGWLFCICPCHDDYTPGHP